MAVSPDGKSAYLAGGPDCGLVFQFDIGAGGALSPKSPAFVAGRLQPACGGGESR